MMIHFWDRKDVIVFALVIVPLSCERNVPDDASRGMKNRTGHKFTATLFWLLVKSIYGLIFILFTFLALTDDEKISLTRWNPQECTMTEECEFSSPHGHFPHHHQTELVFPEALRKHAEVQVDWIFTWCLSFTTKESKASFSSHNITLTSINQVFHRSGTHSTLPMALMCLRGIQSPFPPLWICLAVCLEHSILFSSFCCHFNGQACYTFIVSVYYFSLRTI